ncbi:MAG: excinuclease ABC subunit UvrB [Anaerolineae bacterium]|nr:excinuclease ABC subunit UvrB [Anaerolineae bacterium]
MVEFRLVSDFQPTGDQPQAIEQLVAGLRQGMKHQTLLGATATGKTFTIASVIEQVQRPTLVLAHNKTLAAQLYSEFKDFFPDNAVAYFVSYYDYYQPEAYVPQHDLYIEKDASINDEISRLRLSATQALMTRHDTIIVASVSCIYNIGPPEGWEERKLELHTGGLSPRSRILHHLVGIYYERNDIELGPGKFRVRGDTIEIWPAYEENAYRVELWGDEIQRITCVHPLTGEVLRTEESVVVFPARHFITPTESRDEALERIEAELQETLAHLRENDKLLEAQRLEQRTHYDMEMMREMGYCPGIENYSRHLALRGPGERPWCLLDYFPPDCLMVIDESHMTIPQVRGMYNGDRTRKQTLVDYGFRLPSALDNRPLNFEEFENLINQVVYTSATPGPYEHAQSAQVVEQVIRPTGLVDPQVIVRPTQGQIEDLVGEINERIERGERVLVTALTKRMSEDLADYLMELGLRVHYLHSEIDTIERVEILRDLRLGVYDVVVGVNLLREGLDLPEVSLVAILDADRQGFLRTGSALIQNIGRAARHINGQAILYADTMSEAMKQAIDETNRRRAKQTAYNEAHGIVPASIVKEIRDLTDELRASSRPEKAVAEARVTYEAYGSIPTDELTRLISELESQMHSAAAALEFEKAALIRDQIYELRRQLQDAQTDLPEWKRVTQR